MGKIQEFINLSSNVFNIIRPFFFGRTRDITNVDTVVLHWAATSNKNVAINTLNNLNYGYHFLIDFDGKVYQGSPINKIVSHAGYSYGPRGTQLNSHSIGISFLVNGSGNPNEFSDAMYDSCEKLIKDIKISVPTLKYITGHHWVSPGRKIDPYSFNFQRLINNLGDGYQIWKTGYAPFPLNLTDCKCIRKDENGNCLESQGSCKDSSGNYFSERRLSNEVNSITFYSDLETE